MHFVLRLSRALPLAASLILAVPPTAAEIYKWTDADGKVHFSDQPPPPNVKAPVTVKPRRSTTAADVAAPDAAPATGGPKTYVEQEAEFRKRQVEAAEKAQTEKQAADEAAEKKRTCEQAKARVAGLQANSRITRVNAAGEQIFLTDAEIAQTLAEARSDADAACK
jgi:type IV secretory pathway VirB10-like protein